MSGQEITIIPMKNKNHGNESVMKDSGKMKQSVVWVREPLLRLKQGLVKGRVKIGVLGGSISSPNSNNSAWPDALIAWLLENYPHVRFSVENSAAGRVNSQD